MGRSIQSMERPWQEEERLRELYHERGMSMAEIGEEWECSPQTVSNWVERHGLEARAVGHNGSGPDSPTWVPYARFETNNEGYEVWRSRADNRAAVSVHRLAAVAWYGYDAVVDHDVHHVNGVKWDTRKDNLALLDPSEHRAHHARELHRRGEL